MTTKAKTKPKTLKEADAQVQFKFSNNAQVLDFMLHMHTLGFMSDYGRDMALAIQNAPDRLSLIDGPAYITYVLK
jgi:hypothetical protein